MMSFMSYSPHHFFFLWHNSPNQA